MSKTYNISLILCEFSIIFILLDIFKKVYRCLFCCEIVQQFQDAKSKIFLYFENARIWRI